MIVITTYTGGTHTYVVSGSCTSLQYLCVAGGGGGGYSQHVDTTGGYGGGGGAGGYLAGTITNPTSGNYISIVGGGGGEITKGSNSSISGASLNIISRGGGSGAGCWASNGNVATSGGSGGGGGTKAGYNTWKPGYAGQGYEGAPGSSYAGGGGGSSADAITNTFLGGFGTSNNISGSAITYAIGGPTRSTEGVGAAGTVNRGNGGGGAGGLGATQRAGGAGGSGIIILKAKYSPQVTTKNITGVTNTTAVCMGSVTGITITERGICYGILGSPTTGSTKIICGSGNGSFSTTLTGLTENQLYFVRAYGIDNGDLVYGTQRTFIAKFAEVYVSGFTSNGTLVIPSGNNYMYYLVVAGAGGGGDAKASAPFGSAGGGGGGGGGLVHGETALLVTGDSYAITVGSGGVRNNGTSAPTLGGNSRLSGGSLNILAYGGARGGAGGNIPGIAYSYGENGASGGGGSAYDTIWGSGGGTTTHSDQGHNGASGTMSYAEAGGGGGYSTAGSGYNPGSGYRINYSGALIEYSKGGRGTSAYQTGNGASGAANTGVGGAGGAQYTYFGLPNKLYTGGAGGSGVVYALFGIRPHIYPNAPSGLTATTITFTGATLTWANNNITDILGNYIQIYSGGSWHTIATASSGATTYNLTGLTPNTQYTFRITVYNESFTTSSGSVVFTTDNPKPYNLYVTGKTQITLDLHWTNATGITITDNLVQRYTGSTWFTLYTLAGSADTKTITGLHPYQSYTLRITAVINGLNYPSDAITGTTANINAPVLSGYTASLNAHLSWSDANAEKEHYQIWRTASCFPVAGLSGYYKHDETNGSYLYNSLNVNDAYVLEDNAGSWWTRTNSGKINWALDYGFSGAYAWNPGTTLDYKYDRTQAFSYAMWIKPNGQNTSNEDRVLFSTINAIWGNVGYECRWKTNGTLEFYLQASGGTIKASASGLITDGSWNHLICTYDGSSTANGLKVYIDGVLKTTTKTGSNLTTTTRDANAGTYAMFANRLNQHTGFRGIMDEVAIWSKAIDQTAINTVYNSGNGYQWAETTTLLATTNSGTTSYIDSGLTIGCTYIYCVKAFLDSYDPDVISNCSNQYNNSIGVIIGASNLTASLITPTGCTLTWDINNPLSAVTGQYVQIRSGATWVTIASLVNSASTYVVIGLIPSTSYEFRIVTYNPNQTVYSNICDVDTVNPTPYDFSGYTYNNTIPTIWTLPWSGYGTGIRMEYRISGSTTWIVQTILGNTATGYTFTGLSYSTQYQFRVVLYDIYTDYPSNILTFLTPTIVAPTVITRPLSGITYTEGYSGGIITSDGNVVIIEKGVCWYTSANPTILNFHTMDGTGMTTYTSFMQNLVPNTQYHVRAYAINFAGLIGYGQDLYFWTLGQYCDTYLRFNDDILYDLEVRDFEVNYALSDIKNISEAKTAYTVPIQIPWTPKSTHIFGNLFNITNMSTSTDQKIDCKLIQKDRVIINGYCYVDNIKFDYLEVIVARADLNLFETTKDLTLSQLSFTGSGYTYNNKLMYLSTGLYNFPYISNDYSCDQDVYQYSADTATHHFIWYDWNGAASQTIYAYDWKTPNSQVPKLWTGMQRMTPIIRVKTVFDKIFQEHGYTYSASTGFLDKLQGMFMTTNVPSENYTCNAYSRYFFYGKDSPTGNTGTTDVKYLRPIQYANKSINYNITATTNATAPGGMYTVIIPFTMVDTEYTVKFSAYISSYSGGTIKVSLHRGYFYCNLLHEKDPDVDGNFDIALGEFKYTGSQPYSLQSFTNKVTVKSEDIYPWMKEDYVSGASRLTYQYFLKVVCDPGCYLYDSYSTESTRLEIISPKWLYYTGNTYTLQNLLSNTYTQSNLINDISNMFDLYIYVKETDKKHLYLYTCDDFYTNDVIDWSKKFTTEKLELFDTSKQLYEKYIITFKPDQDKIGKSYTDKFKKVLNEEDIYNNNELAITNINTVDLQANKAIIDNNFLLPQAIKTGPSGTDIGPINYYIGSNQSNENSSIVFGYINKFCSGVMGNVYGNFCTMTEFGLWITGNSTFINYFQCFYMGYTAILAYLTLSPYKLTKQNLKIDSSYYISGSTRYDHSNSSDINEISDPQTFALLYNTKNTYITNDQQQSYMKPFSGKTITNNNLYNNFWKTDIETKLFSQQKFLKCYIKLYPSDLNIENFRKRIYVDNAKLGSNYYRLNKVVYTSNESKTAYVEMINDSYYDASYSGLTAPVIYKYDGKETFLYKDTSIPPTTGSTGTTSGATIYFSGGIPAGYIDCNSTNTSGKTVSVNLYYSVDANCDVETPGDRNQATTDLYYSLDGTWSGATLYTIGHAYCECITGTSASQTVTGNTTISGITDILLLKFYGNWNYNTGRSGQGGGYTLWLKTASINTGSITVVPDNYAQAGGSSIVPYLSYI